MAGKLKILVVDDELPVCKSIASVLENRNSLVETALSGEEALKKDLKQRYDLIITDLMMPGISGLEVLATIKKRRARAAVIMITGFPSIKTAVESIKSGAFDYLPKPFTPQDLRNIVQRVRASRKTDRTAETAPKMKTHQPQLYCIPDNSWVQVGRDGLVTVGIHHKFLKGLGPASAIELPEVGDKIIQGEAYAAIRDTKKHSHRLWMPVSGQIASVNKEIKNDMSLLEREPYGRGWLVKVSPTQLEDDLNSLLVLNS
ncbi:MAG: response regulator [Candidatus Edwardsbacteria bacterium]|nr:response regulator [Candidatus Edwardsbacteria bacterium]MBU1577212.1 response regulator [Candidatus Edwardsbacteria bacterium]MBU2463713.1 response regulator [Candidatus Edwardsbacteria bacterium]MBU2594113.1 response regulator [Candidatus Edwardsbacteria bacterium]